MKPDTDASILAAALIVSLVSLSPARALADELPKDTNQIESLTPEQAKEFGIIDLVVDKRPDSSADRATSKKSE